MKIPLPFKPTHPRMHVFSCLDPNRDVQSELNATPILVGLGGLELEAGSWKETGSILSFLPSHFPAPHTGISFSFLPLRPQELTRI